MWCDEKLKVKSELNTSYISWPRSKQIFLNIQYSTANKAEGWGRSQEGEIGQDRGLLFKFGYDAGVGGSGGYLCYGGGRDSWCHKRDDPQEGIDGQKAQARRPGPRHGVLARPRYGTTWLVSGLYGRPNRGVVLGPLPRHSTVQWSGRPNRLI